MNDAYGLALALKNIYQSRSTLGMTYPDAQNIHDSAIHRNVYAKLRVARALKQYRKKYSVVSPPSLGKKLIDILENNYGNPLIVNLFNKCVSFEALYHSLILMDLHELLPLTNLHNKSIIDLGSGLGIVLAIMMNLLGDIECTYIDLPENLIYVAWFVSKYCPEMHVNYGNISKSTSKPIINLIPYYSIDKIPSNSSDLFINTFSLPEMDEMASVAYLKDMYRILKKDGKLFSINRQNTLYGKGGDVNYTMTGINELIQSVELFDKSKEINTKLSFSMSNDPLYPEINTEIALYKKRPI